MGSNYHSDYYAYQFKEFFSFADIKEFFSFADTVFWKNRKGRNQNSEFSNPWALTLGWVQKSCVYLYRHFRGIQVLRKHLGFLLLLNIKNLV